MATRAEAAEKMRALSGQISTLIRTISLSVLAVSWLFLSGSKDASSLISLVPKSHMLMIAILSVIALALDLIQYMVAFAQVSGDYNKVSGDEKVIYSDSKLRTAVFYAKQYVALIAATWLVGLLLWAILATQPVKVETPLPSCEMTVNFAG